jgi:hypothetical protein
MGASQRNKGARGEREACVVLERMTGEPWQRSCIQSRRGGSEAPDVAPVNAASPRARLHVEVKRGARIGWNAAMRQAVRDAGDGRVPLVLARQDRGPWELLMRVEDWDEVRGLLCCE